MAKREQETCQCPLCGDRHQALAPIATTLAALLESVLEIKERLARLEAPQPSLPSSSSPLMNGRRLVSKKELKSSCGIPLSLTHIARLEAVGKFPKRVKLGDHRSSRCAWYADEVDAWLRTHRK